MQVTIKLKGTTPLLMHNPRLSDKRDPITSELSQILKKKTKMTEAERTTVEDLEYLGGLYHDKELGPYVEGIAVLRTVQEAGKITRQGRDVLRAITPINSRFPLQYDGPKKVEDLKKLPEYRLRMSVGNKTSRIMRVRPMFRDWSLTFEGIFLEDAGLSKSTLPEICEIAGRSVGLLDGRIIGYGRFTSEVSFSNDTI